MTISRATSVRKKALRRLDGEPSLREMLDDPVMQAIMARDGVERAALENLICQVRARLDGSKDYSRRAS